MRGHGSSASLSRQRVCRTLESGMTTEPMISAGPPRASIRCRRGLAYAVGWVSGIALIVFEPNKFVRFHALQSTIVSGRCRSPGWSRFRCVLGWMWRCSSFRRSGGAWLLLMYKAFQGERFRCRSPATWRSKGVMQVNFQLSTSNSQGSRSNPKVEFAPTGVCKPSTQSVGVPFGSWKLEVGS